MQMKFKAPKKKAVNIEAEIHSSTATVSEMKGYVLHQKVEDELIIDARVPEAGDWVLELYARDTSGYTQCKNIYRFYAQIPPSVATAIATGSLPVVIASLMLPGY